MFLFFLLLVTFIIFIYFLRNPTEVLVPYNLLIENLYEKKVFYSEEEKKKIFPTSIILEKEWKNIRDEFLNFVNDNENYKFGNVGKNFIIESEDFWNGWTSFPLRMFGKDNEENMNKCPTLKKILKADKDIPTAFFSIMEPGKTLPSHYGPFKGILRYHLGLKIAKKGNCFISVDGETYDWKEGEGILFDETYKHFVINDTDEYRVILFIDVKRPLDFPLNIVNDSILYLMGISPYN